VFDLLQTRVIGRDWVLLPRVIVPSVASAVTISPTKTLDQSPAQWVWAAILIGYGITAGIVGTMILHRHDVV
jgi:ABC-2 type transport system permease protein